MIALAPLLPPAPVVEVRARRGKGVLLRKSVAADHADRIVAKLRTFGFDQIVVVG